jgi:hypothetical protein
MHQDTNSAIDMPLVAQFAIFCFIALAIILRAMSQY